MNDAPLSLPPRALEWAIALVHSAPPLSGPGPLLAAAGMPVCYLLYCSTSVAPFSEAQLADLLEQSRAHNSQYNITGLLCYDQGHFVQVLEGSEQDIDQLFVSIQNDSRHHHVRELRCGISQVRQFADWHMAFAKSDAKDFYWLISYLDAQRYRLLLPQVPVPEPSLLLLHLFSSICVNTPPYQRALLGVCHSPISV